MIDSRASREGATIRRRRECLKCNYRFTTYEEVERAGLMVVKIDGRREEFSREKLLSGIKRACQKRPVSPQAIETMVDTISQELSDTYDGEVPSRDIGERVMNRLRDLDTVAYVRYASVYRRFEEAGDFVQEVHELQKRRRDDPAQSRLFDLPNFKR